MAWIFMVMLGMIVGSIVLELVLPQRVKNALGSAICWMMMGITMGFLVLAAFGLVAVTVQQYLLPFFA